MATNIKPKFLNGKYAELLKAKELPQKMSIIELEVLGKMLGIDTGAMREKHLSALHSELRKAVKVARGEL